MKNLHILIITGLSGSGRSTAINALEDAGYFCVDNLPVVLLPKFLEVTLGSGSEIQKLAFGMDLRQKEFVKNFAQVLSDLRREGYRFIIFFLESSEEVLVKRFSETRRQHPIFSKKGLLASIRSEKEQLAVIRGIADRIIDTSSLTVHELRDRILQEAGQGARAQRMRISLTSFGYKYGVPLEADLVIDVRFIPNPHFVPELKKLNGQDERVRAFVMRWAETRAFLQKYLDLLDYLIPLYEKEGKAYLTIAIGCTGGRHRSVTIAQAIFEHLRTRNEEIILNHRDMALYSNSSDSSAG